MGTKILRNQYSKTLQSVHPISVMVDESVREKERSEDEEEGEDIEDVVCQLLNQRMASQCRDKSYAPSH